VNVETREKITAAKCARCCRQAPGVEVVDEPEPGGYPTPVTHASGRDPVYVGRIRDDASHPRAVNLWIVADNIRKGAALNAVRSPKWSGRKADRKPVHVRETAEGKFSRGMGTTMPAATRGLESRGALRGEAMTFDAYALAIAWAVAGRAVAAWALARIQVKSRVDKPLLAEIPIVSSDPAETGTIQARLASPENLRRIRLEPPSAPPRT
jgi:hypothetical protein